MGGTAAAAGGLANTSVSFVYALAAAPAINFVRQGAAAPAACTGNATFPQAAAGNVCIYEAERLNTVGGIVNEVEPVRRDDLHQLDGGRRLLQLRNLGRDRIMSDECGGSWSFAS